MRACASLSWRPGESLRFLGILSTDIMRRLLGLSGVRRPLGTPASVAEPGRRPVRAPHVRPAFPDDKT